jgi:hypothetical protein
MRRFEVYPIDSATLGTTVVITAAELAELAQAESTIRARRRGWCICYSCRSDSLRFRASPRARVVTSVMELAR